MTTADLVRPAPRIDLNAVAPELYRAMIGLETAVRHAGLEKPLLELIKTRASQINGCAFCLDMHTKDAMHAGETPQRLFALDAWEEAPFFTARERAALGLTDAMTRIAETHVPDEAWNAAAEQFDERELAALVFAITTINAWNRIAISSRAPAGSYEPS